MAKPTVYIETTIVSYLTARPTTDALRQGHQELTKRWWRERASQFNLVTSRFTINEASAGDPNAAAERLVVLNAIPPLELSNEIEPLALRLLADAAMPSTALVDALHLAIATVHGVEYLLTWNCEHLANAVLWRKIEQTCRAAGFYPPTICTPYELLGDNP